MTHRTPQKQWISKGMVLVEKGNCLQGFLVPWKPACCHSTQNVSLWGRGCEWESVPIHFLLSNSYISMLCCVSESIPLTRPSYHILGAAPHEGLPILYWELPLTRGSCYSNMLVSSVMSISASLSKMRPHSKTYDFSPKWRINLRNSIFWLPWQRIGFLGNG